MNQKRNTKQALVLSALSLMLCFCMLIGSTFAWFTDSVSSDRNTIVAGNLDIELDYYKNGQWTTVEGQSDIFDPAAKWEPGRTEVVYFKVHNAGNLALKYIFGINIIGETKATNVNGEIFKLSDYIMFNIVENVNPETDAFADRKAAIDAADDGALTLQQSVVGNIHDDSLVRGDLEKNEYKYIAVVLWMPGEEVGNEANTMPNTVAPSIDLGVSVIATQKMTETDSFDNSYDGSSTFPTTGKGSVSIVGGILDANGYDFPVRGANNAKIGAFTVPAPAIDPNATALEGTIEKVDAVHSNINIAGLDGKIYESYEITLTGIKENNDTEVWVTVRLSEIPAGTFVDENSIVIYHNGVAIPDADILDYNPMDKNLTFKTKSFSPFTFVYDAKTTTAGSEETPPIPLSKLPVASLVQAPEYAKGGTKVDEIVWGDYGVWSPSEGLEAVLEACYVFSTTETTEEVKQNPFANWNCDFVLSLDKDLGENEIFLGGNYGDFGWVGFHNCDITLNAYDEVYLLDSVAGSWTYDKVADFVGTFICGVGDVDGQLAAKRATITVSLRVWNPDNFDEYYDIAVVKHTFGTDFANDSVVDVPNTGNNNENTENNG